MTFLQALGAILDICELRPRSDECARGSEPIKRAVGADADVWCYDEAVLLDSLPLVEESSEVPCH